MSMSQARTQRMTDMCPRTRAGTTRTPVTARSWSQESEVAKGGFRPIGTLGHACSRDTLREIGHREFHSRRSRSHPGLRIAVAEFDMASRNEAKSESVTQREVTQTGALSVRRAALLASTSHTGVVQRVRVKLDGGVKDLNEEGVASMLIEAGKIIEEDLGDEFWDAIEAIDQEQAEGESFASLDELLLAIQARLGADELPEAPAEVEFNLNRWQVDEDPTGAMKGNRLNDIYTKGKSVREGMDYKTVDKDAFEVAENEDLALIIRIKRPGGAGTIWGESETLNLLKSKGIPTAAVVDIGHYVIDGQALPAMVMQRYFLSSKTIARMKGGKSKVPTASEHSEEAFEQAFRTVEECDNGLKSLAEVEEGLRKQGKGVDDIQFLIADDGRFVINDASSIDAQYLDENIVLIKHFEEIIKARKVKLAE